MKFQPFSTLFARRTGLANGFLLSIVAALAVGVGVTGTLLWTQSRGAAPTPTPAATSVGGPSGLPPNLPSGLPSGIPPGLPGIPENGAAGVAPETAAPAQASQAQASQAQASQAQASPPSIAGMNSAEAALTLGNYYYDQQQWPQAIASYRAAIAGGYDNPNVRTDYGNSLRFANQPKQALEQYRIAQKEDPTHEQSLFNQGGLWAFALKDKRQGVLAWRAYLKKFPQGQSAAQAKQFIKDNQ